MDKKMIHMVTFTLALVGALNLGLAALLGFNVIETVVGSGDLARVVYILVGASAVYVFMTHKADCKICG